MYESGRPLRASRRSQTGFADPDSDPDGIFAPHRTAPCTTRRPISKPARQALLAILRTAPDAVKCKAKDRFGPLRMMVTESARAAAASLQATRSLSELLPTKRAT